MRPFVAVLLSAVALTLGSDVIRAEEAVSYNRDVRPILSDKCFACHGPDERARKAGLRLDLDGPAFQPAKSGAVALVPGDLQASELVARILTDDADDKMPPKEFGKDLSAAEVDILKRWVSQGAKYEKHWAFLPPAHPEVPAVNHGELVKNPIDAFLLERLEQDGLCLSREADRPTLIRRLSLDLTGLPPSPAEVDAFVNDSRSDAYEQLVDRLLAKPTYGEHMARKWLDISRYADTNGYHIDNERYMWRWRDWVIDAFNSDKPFDDFTVEQLAGDLLPNPTLEQRIATGFSRNHMITFEGGIIPEEYRMQYVVDRVNTTSTAWMGLTMGCAQCHDHKYDPISMKEFYSFYAFFNSVPESGSDGNTGNSRPFIKAPLPEQQARMTTLDQQIASLQQYMNRPLPEIDAAQAAWESARHAQVSSRWKVLAPTALASTGGATLNRLEDGSVRAEGAIPNQDVYEITTTLPGGDLRALRVEALVDPALPNTGPGLADNSNFVLGEIEAEVSPANSSDITEKLRFAAANADYSQPKFDVALAIDGNTDTGWGVDGNERHENRTAIFVADRPYGFADGTLLKVRLRFDSTRFNKHAIGRFRVSATTDPSMSAAALGAWYINGPFVAPDAKTAFATAYDPETKVDLAETYPDQRQKWIPARGLSDGTAYDLPGDIAATYLYRTIESPSARKMTLSLASNDAVKVWLNGQVIHSVDKGRSLKPDEDQINVQLQPGTNQLLVKVVNYGSAYQFYFRKAFEEVGDIPLSQEALFATAPQDRSPAQQEELRTLYRREHWSDWKPLENYLATLRDERTKLDAEIPTAMVMEELPEPRETFVLARGQYDQPTDKVTPGVPASLGGLPGGAPNNRLGLAKWLVDEKNPLTARVVVNRFWQHYFGNGIVKTVEDFGLQGEWPTHPELLDWLATEFVASGWDVKALQRTIVTSAAYRQDSRSNEQLNQRDPENRLLARGPRFRLEAETIRDNALAASGLLVPVIGGPSVRPYQPDLWKEVSYGGAGTTFTAQVFVQDQGEKLYRRSMYTFWKRQSPPPTMLTFDAPTREVCSARRARTNTPLQALALMNDPQFVEASRFLAQRVLKESPADLNARIDLACKITLARTPNDAERTIMAGFLQQQGDAYRATPDAATKLLSVGDSRPDPALDPVELATWSTFASMLLNLDEAISKI